MHQYNKATFDMIVLNEEYMCTVILKASHVNIYNEETFPNVSR